jgi:hypothetical protein
VALVTIRVGSAVDIFQYDDAAFDSAIETTAPIKAGKPADPSDVTRLADAGSLIGDVVGPAAATDNAIARFDGVTGKLIQNSPVTIDDVGSLNIPTGQGCKVNSVQVVTDQQAAEADAAVISAIALGAGGDSVDRAAFNTDLNTLVTEINALRTTVNSLLAKLRTHGLINT